jgi:hypothetical protein
MTMAAAIEVDPSTNAHPTSDQPNNSRESDRCRRKAKKNKAGPDASGNENDDLNSKPQVSPSLRRILELGNNHPKCHTKCNPKLDFSAMSFFEC